MSEIALPPPAIRTHDDLLRQMHGGYTAEQVRAAILAERERCARVCDILAHEGTTCQGDMTDLYKFGEAIRRGSV